MKIHEESAKRGKNLTERSSWVSEQRHHCALPPGPPSSAVPPLGQIDEPSIWTHVDHPQLSHLVYSGNKFGSSNWRQMNCLIAFIRRTDLDRSCAQEWTWVVQSPRHADRSRGSCVELMLACPPCSRSWLAMLLTWSSYVARTFFFVIWPLFSIFF